MTMATSPSWETVFRVIPMELQPEPTGTDSICRSFFRVSATRIGIRAMKLIFIGAFTGDPIIHSFLKAAGRRYGVRRIPMLIFQGCVVIPPGTVVEIGSAACRERGGQDG